MPRPTALMPTSSPRRRSCLPTPARWTSMTPGSAGGFPEPQPPIPCEGDACQVLPAVPTEPSLATLAKGAATRAVSYRKYCRKGYVKRKGICEKKGAAIKGGKRRRGAGDDAAGHCRIAATVWLTALTWECPSGSADRIARPRLPTPRGYRPCSRARSTRRDYPPPITSNTARPPTSPPRRKRPASRPGSGTAEEQARAAIGGLSPNTTYYFRLVAANSSGTATGDASRASKTTGFGFLPAKRASRPRSRPTAGEGHARRLPPLPAQLPLRPEPSGRIRGPARRGLPRRRPAQPAHRSPQRMIVNPSVTPVCTQADSTTHASRPSKRAARARAARTRRRSGTVK